ncbi:nematode cuticle collagen domain protein [Ancylostoma duodenale]|uniref:Nematode cuticle collagen domain protein n=1 Tax=Ancylostoma duodenale TaxID=51022 RepID=A0A0C2GTQ9_9BILA|nr:nematode cuticle collagen domain protein [Ancylostoma duodenale]
MEQDCERKSLRPLALASVALATVSVLSCIISLPLVYNHVQSIQSYMQNEVDFCKTRSREMWREMVTVQFSSTGKVNDRVRREAYDAQPVDNRSNPSSAGGSCCTCQVKIHSRTKKTHSLSTNLCLLRLDHPDLLVHQDEMDGRELLEGQEILDRQEETAHFYLDHHQSLLAKNAHLDLRDHQAS